MTTTLIADRLREVDAEGLRSRSRRTGTRKLEAGNRVLQRHRRIDAPPLAGVQLHARSLPRNRDGTLDPRARQGVRRPRRGALPALPQGAGQARRQDRRHPQATRLHLGRSTR